MLIFAVRELDMIIFGFYNLVRKQTCGEIKKNVGAQCCGGCFKMPTEILLPLLLLLLLLLPLILLLLPRLI